MEAYLLHYNRRSLLSFLLIVVLASLSFVFTVHAQTDGALPSGPSEEQMRAALNDLGRIYGEPVETVVEAKVVCNIEKYIDGCAQIGKQYNLYKPEELTQVNVLLEEIKGSVAKTLENCVTDECILGVAQELANRVVKKNPALATRLDLTQRKVNEQKQIAKAAVEIGIDLKACRDMDPDTAPVDMLRSCAKLARHPSVERYISVEVRRGVDAIDKTAELRETLAKGELSCGDNTLEGCGNYCLNPAAELRSQGVSAIQPVCRQIAEKYFGTEGIKSLEAAYAGVEQIAEYYKKQSTDIVFTTLDGRILTNLADIGRYMEEQGRKGNVEAIEKGMDFMVARGFVKPEEKEFAISMVKKFKERGGINDFDVCSKDPGQCAQYIPQEYRGEFDVFQKVQAIAKKELGFDPRECQFKNCVEGIKRALPQIEALGSDNPNVKKIIEDMRSGIRQSEARPQFETAVQQGGGPGRCRSEAECNAYCSDLAHGPECLAFGAKHKVFQGEDVVKRYQEYHGYTQGGPQAFISFPSSTSAPFPGQGPYPGFQPGEIPPPGQYPGFTQPGPGFTPPPGFSGPGPSPECFAAIQSGDFAKARTACYVPPQPVYQRFCAGVVDPAVCANQPGTIPSQDLNCEVRCVPAPQSCPAVAAPYCPEGQRAEAFRDARGCTVYGACVSSGQSPSTGSIVYPVAIAGGSYGRAVEALQACQINANRLTQVERDLCAAIGREAGSTTPPPTVCPAFPTVDTCPTGSRRTLSFSSPACGEYYTCVPESSTIPPPGGGGQSCDNSLIALLGSGCHYMYNDSSGNQIFCDGPMSRSARRGDSAVQSGCQSGGGGPSTPPSGQREQVWNSLGLRSWIRSDADTARIEQLKQACTSAPSGANVWLPQAGNSASVDFGMPDPAKCQLAASCPSGQYFNGSSCSTSGSGTGGNSSISCEQYGTGWHTMDSSGNCFNSAMTEYRTPAGTLNSCSSASVPGCSGSGTSYPPSCPSGQYWNGNACVNSTSGTTNCEQYGTGWHTMDSSGNCFNPTMTEYKTANGTLYSCSATPATGCSGGTYTASSSCPSSQYWNGTACVAIGTCPSGQYWTGYTCATGTSGATSCPSGYYWNGSTCAVYYSGATSCPSGQTWNGSSCVSPTSTPTTTSCPSGQYWNGSACVSSTSGTTCPSGQYWYVPPSGGAGYCTSSGAGGTYTGGSCTSALIDLLGTGCHYMYNDSSGSAVFCDGPMTKYAKSGDTVTTPGCSGSGGTYTTTSCPSGQYWNGSACVNSTSGTTNCDQYGTGWHTMDSSGNCFNSAMTEYKTPAGTLNYCSSAYVPGCSGGGSTTPSCPSGQYWNGSACVATSVTDCASGQYWNGTSCVANTTTDPATACSQAGGTWNSETSYCTMPGSSSLSPNYLLSSVVGVLDNILKFFGSLLR